MPQTLSGFLAFMKTMLVVEPGRLAKGKREIRAAFEQIFSSKASAKQKKSVVIEADGIALFISQWTFSRNEPDGCVATGQFIATSVCRKQNDGSWRLLIDNSFGPSVLE